MTTVTTVREPALTAVNVHRSVHHGGDGRHFFF
jgi:hypothetical protein